MSIYKAIRANSSLTHVYIWGNKLEESVCVVRLHVNVIKWCSITAAKNIERSCCS